MVQVTLAIPDNVNALRITNGTAPGISDLSSGIPCNIWKLLRDRRALPLLMLQITLSLTVAVAGGARTGKARRLRIPGVFEGGATPPDGMPRPGATQMADTGH